MTSAAMARSSSMSLASPRQTTRVGVELSRRETRTNKRPGRRRKTEASKQPPGWRSPFELTLRGARDGLSRSIWMWLLVSVALQQEVNCLRISSIRIPPAIANGSHVTLVCEHELGPGEQLYSVTWYKDRVEFYRYKLASETTSSSELDVEARNSNSNQQAEAKHSFDWTGINLDLTRSNSTHVHLKQVTIQSEGMFECEVIAEEQSFATVSAARPLKVYVLPKLKIRMLNNNNNSSNNTASHDAQTTTQLGEPNERDSLYQPNELLNFSCISGPSRPAARLSWHLNDWPLTSGEQAETKQTVSELKGGLFETRSTLTFRMQPSQWRPALKASQRQHLAGGRGSFLALKLACLAQFQVEFSSNTSLLISGGKTSGATKRGRSRGSVQPPDEVGLDGLPQAAAHSRRRPQDLALDTGESQTAGFQRDQLAQGARQEQDEHLMFRWPPVAGGGGWRRPEPNRAPPDGYETNQQDAHHHELMSIPARRVVVWTNKQLRNQMETISKLMTMSKANELEPARITARTVPTSGRRAEPSSESWTEFEQPSWALNQTAAVEQMGSPNKDFDLHELVNFTCHQEDRKPAMHSVRLRWFLNNLELSGAIVNAFEPKSGFHYDVRESKAGQFVAWNSSATSATSASSLLIEFTPALVRLKELDLRCEVVVGQPLIEFESVQYLNLAASPFTQASGENGGQPAPRPSSPYNVHSRQRKPRPNNVIRVRPPSRVSSGSGGAIASTSWAALAALLVASLLVIFL